MIRRLFTLLAVALPLNAGALNNTLQGVRLDVHQYDTNWRTAGVERESRLTRLVLVLDEQASSRIYGGLRAGYVDVSRPGDSVAAGLDMHGQSLGVRLGGFLMRGKHVDVLLQADHDYLQASATRDGRETELDWTETVVELRAVVDLGSFRLTGAGYRYRVDGDRKQRGPANATDRFRQGERTGVSAGLELQVDATGRIGIHAGRGARDGVRVSFIREFR